MSALTHHLSPSTVCPLWVETSERGTLWLNVPWRPSEADQSWWPSSTHAHFCPHNLLLSCPCRRERERDGRMSFKTVSTTIRWHNVFIFDSNDEFEHLYEYLECGWFCTDSHFVLGAKFVSILCHKHEFGIIILPTEASSFCLLITCFVYVVLPRDCVLTQYVLTFEWRLF